MSANISQSTFADEADCVQALLEQLKGYDALSGAIHARAEHYIGRLRASRKISPLEAFQQEYSLSSQEGILIMCLAEALLRIPDKATASALIQDKLTPGEWDRHIGLGRSFLVNASGVGLGLAGRVTDEDTLRQSAGGFIGALIHRLGEPVVRAVLRHAMGLMGGVFVFGKNIDAALKKADGERGKGNLFSFDMLGEGARSAEQAEEYFRSYEQALAALATQKGNARDSISIKLSALHPRLELRHWPTLERELLPKLRALLLKAAKHDVPVTVDAEEATRFDVILKLLEALFTDPALKSYAGLGLAVQAYQKRAPHMIAWLADIAEKTGRRIPVRLVKGAYWDSEIKRAQMEGLPAYPVFTRKVHTDVSYLACAQLMLASPRFIFPQFATHNAHTIAAIVEMAGKREFEFQRLHGMAEGLYDIVLEETGRKCRVYAPVGAPASLLSYLIRRILENGANSSFVRGLYDAPLIELLADPVASARDAQGLAENIKLPENLYPDRLNSKGIDMGNQAMLKMAQEQLSAWPATSWSAPADASRADCDAAFARAEKGFTKWKDTPAEDRAAMLERAAELFTQHESELIALCIHEAGKTLADAVAEVREAVDYCRYYAREARRIFAAVALAGPSGERNTLLLHPRGVMVAISPWNFPLAIFTGQISAALVTGNAVLAKPAEETPKIAARATELLHEAGIPKDVLQLLPGSGEVVGAALVSDSRTRGVVFTGSTETANLINRSLAAREGGIVPLIAETGGQNCMIVDSSALVEQTVDDIVVSAFGSAGQRCSSLRVAFVQEDIADELLKVLGGAMQQLHVGDPVGMETDIGPVISKEAYDRLASHIAAMQQSAKFIAAAPLPADATAKRLIAPHAFEIPSINVLKGEVFGPILHVVRYKEGALDDVIAQVNSTGYGLTFGIQSRIDDKISYVCGRVRAGNVYVNRSMIGAVVGVQPFGGHGLSGTGPKAGGPNYLPRFCIEQTVTINTAAVGGNLELLV